MRVVTSQEMKAIDRAAIESLGIPGVVLMENAGRGVFIHRPSDRISLTSTLKLSGMPDSNVSSPRTIAS